MRRRRASRRCASSLEGADDWVSVSSIMRFRQYILCLNKGFLGDADKFGFGERAEADVPPCVTCDKIRQKQTQSVNFVFILPAEFD